MNFSDRNSRKRSCDRCNAGIPDIVPAAVLSFGGAIESDELVVCIDCMEPLVEWWETRPQAADSDRKEADR